MSSENHGEQPLFGAEVQAQSKPQDPCWEALVRATNANEDFERGNLNRALQAIRSAARNEGLVDDEAVAAEIPLRANAYRQRFAHCALTPTALAKHWCRVMITPLAGNTTQDDAVARARLIR